MILLESTNTIDIVRKNKTITTKVYVMGDFVTQTKTKLKFREVYYIYDQEENIGEKMSGGPAKLIEIKLPESSDETVLNLEMKDIPLDASETEIAELTEYNRNTVDYMFNTFGKDITRKTKLFPLGTGYSKGTEENFNHIFHVIQSIRKYYGVTSWIIVQPTI
tara:strand:- start:4418 stop:4906 length:489 start_codon:yes stop_codon:yes gene_type:complete